MSSKIIPIFTRYLYYFNDVIQSLKQCILQSKVDEALFWAYELYYSGFQNLLIENVLQEYKKFHKMVSRWNESKNPTFLADIIHTIIIHQKTPSKKIFIVHYDEKQVEEYKTIVVSPDIRSYRILQIACKYSVYDIDSDNAERETLLNKYFYHWEYYSFFTPIWKERIEKYGGKQNNETQKIVFADEDKEEEFYMYFGYEPDEQPLIITQRHGYYSCR